MTRPTILCATDLTDQGERAAALAALFARAIDGRVVLLHVSAAAPAEDGAVPASVAEGAATLRGRLHERLEGEAKRLEAQREHCEVRGVECEAAVVEGRPAEAIEREATSREAILVVLGRRADRDEGYVGPTIHRLARRAPCPVLVSPPSGPVPTSLADGPWVVGVDFSRQARVAMAAAEPLARALGGRILLAHVAAPSIGEDELAWGRRSSHQVLHEDGVRADERKLEALAQASSVDSRAVQRVSHDTPAHELSKLADEVDATMIVLGSHGRTGFGRFFLGSVGDGVLRTSRRPVLVVRNTPPAVKPWYTEPPETVSAASPSRLLVAVDFSEAACRALDVARRLAARLEVPVEVVHVHEPPTDVRRGLVSRLAAGDRSVEVDPDTRRHLQQALEETVRAAFGADAENVTLHVEAGRAVERVCALAEERGADLVVVGTTGRSRVERALLGSVAEAMIRRSHVPVLAVH